MGTTTIEWTDQTWNPVTGCSKVSLGCKNCYAERVFPRAYTGQCVCGCKEVDHNVFADGFNQIRNCTICSCERFQQRQFIDVLTHYDRLEQPLHWKKPRRVFVNSMSDLFHEDVPFEFIDKVFAVMALTPQHTYQILTKRPERMLEYMAASNGAGARVYVIGYTGTRRVDPNTFKWPLPNVWLGVSCEDQKTADARIPLLLQTQAAIRFVSYEPALAPVDFEKIPLPDGYLSWAGIVGVLQPTSEKETEPDDYRYFRRKELKLDWVIIGGESGPNARPFNIQWARDVVRQCHPAIVAVFVKQLGAKPVYRCLACLDYPGQCRRFGENGHGSDGLLPLYLKDRKGGNMEEWPSDLQIREFPNVR